MQLVLYTFKGEKNLVDKTEYMASRRKDDGTPEYIFNNVVLKDNCSITAPVIIINLKGDEVNANYAYIREFNRYYFIDDIISLNNNLWELRMSVDVLMTYKDGIRNLRGFVERSESYYDRTLVDKKRVIGQGYKSVTRTEFEVPTNDLFTYNAFDDSCFVVTGVNISASTNPILPTAEEI